MSSDFLNTNSAFLLSAFAMLGAFCAGLGHCILKSRCTTIKCCGLQFERDVLPASQIHIPEDHV